MKNAKKIYGIGQLILLLGSALYLASLLFFESWTTTLIISAVYAVALILLLIGWIGTKDERRAEKERAKAEKAA